MTDDPYDLEAEGTAPEPDEPPGGEETRRVRRPRAKNVDAEDLFRRVADLIAGEVSLPSLAEMRSQIQAYDHALRKRYVASKRHTIQVDAHDYKQELLKERKARRVG